MFQVIENRHYLKTVCEILRLSATQNVAQRGHRESAESQNRGNFLEILDLISTRDDVVRKRVEFGPQNAKYTHHSVQNAVIKIMAESILSDIRDEVEKSRYFGIICDETKDLSKKEQISLVVRYIYDGFIHEEFVGFTYAESVDAKSLCTYITSQLETVGIDIKDCIGQSYDGASVMSGRLSGVQKRVKEHVDWAIYVHCYAHRLNLVVIDSCKAVKYAADFFAQLQRLYVFMSGSFVHPKWLILQQELYPHEKAIELKSFSETRWSAQIAACHAVKNRFDVILALLEQIGEDTNRDRAVEAQSILQMIDLKFVFCLEIFNEFLKEMKSASDCLQSTQMNANIACDLITNCLDFFREKRNEADCMKHVIASKGIVDEHGLSSNIMRRRTRVPRRLEGDMVVTEGIGRNETSHDVDVFLRNDIYYPVIDKAITELDARFSGDNMKILRALQALTAGSASFLNGEILAPLACNYKANMDDVNLELRQLKRMIERKQRNGTMPTFEGDKLMAFTRFIAQYDEAFYELHRLAVIACTIPVTSVQSERSFSCLKLIKTHLRTTMLDDRLSDVAVLSMHSARARSLDLDKVVDKFVAVYPHCRIQLTL